MEELYHRAIELLYATKEILEKANNSCTVVDVMSTLATWDGVECDGHCLLEDITVLLDEIEESGVQ